MNYPKLFDVTGKVVLVTGGSRGIGEMIATGFVSAGARVYITSRSSEACEKVAHTLNTQGPGQCYSIPADLQELEQVHHLVAELSKREDHLDVLVNNAGAAWGASFIDFPESGFDKVLNLNLKRIFTLTQACHPLLTAKSSVENPARVINIGSVNGLSAPFDNNFSYTAAKAGVHHLSRHLAYSLGYEGITVNVIAPGPFPSKMIQFTLEHAGEVIISRVPVGRIGTPEDIAGTCIYLSSRAGQYTNGALIQLDGGYTVNNFAPKL